VLRLNFQRQFLCQKITGVFHPFSAFFSFENINLGDYYVLNFYLTPIFLSFFSEIMSIFCPIGIRSTHKIQ
jgi:hypothetical protein